MSHPACTGWAGLQRPGGLRCPTSSASEPTPHTLGHGGVPFTHTRTLKAEPTSLRYKTDSAGPLPAHQVLKASLISHIFQQQQWLQLGASLPNIQTVQPHGSPPPIKTVVQLPPTQSLQPGNVHVLLLPTADCTGFNRCMSAASARVAAVRCSKAHQPAPQAFQYLYVLTAADSSPAQLSTTGWLKPL